MDTLQVGNDFRFVLFSDLFQRFSIPKARRKVIFILEAAIRCYEKSGFEAITFKMVARECGLSPSSLKHYFRNLPEVQTSVVKYIYLNYQNVILESINEESDPQILLTKYLEGHAVWAKKYGKHLKVWNSFILFRSKTEFEQSLKDSALSHNQFGLTNLLALGRTKGVFFHSEDVPMAQVLHTIISGWLIMIADENNEIDHSYTKTIFRQCFLLVTRPAERQSADVSRAD